MSKFEEREVKLVPTCLTCKYHREFGNEYFADVNVYCMLGASYWETKYVDLMERDKQDWDDRYCKIMMITLDEEGFPVESKRHVPHNSICQFYEKDEEEDEE